LIESLSSSSQALLLAEFIKSIRSVSYGGFERRMQFFSEIMIDYLLKDASDKNIRVKIFYYIKADFNFFAFHLKGEKLFSVLW